MKSTQPTKKFHTDFKSATKIAAPTAITTHDKTKRIEDDLQIPSQFTSQRYGTQRPFSQKPYSQNPKKIVLKQVHLNTEEDLQIKREKVKKEMENKQNEIITLDDDELNFSSELLNGLNEPNLLSNNVNSSNSITNNDLKITPLTTSTSSTSNNNTTKSGSDKYDSPIKRDTKDIRMIKKDKDEKSITPTKQSIAKRNQNEVKRSTSQSKHHQIQQNQSITKTINTTVHTHINTTAINGNRNGTNFVEEDNISELIKTIDFKEPSEIQKEFNSTPTSVNHSFRTQKHNQSELLSPIKRDGNFPNTYQSSISEHDEILIKSKQVEESLAKQKKELIKTTSLSIRSNESNQSNRMTTSFMEEEGKQMNSEEIKQILEACCHFFHEGNSKITCDDMYKYIKIMVKSSNNDEVLDKLIDLSQCPLFRFTVLEEAQIINANYENVYIEKQNVINQFNQSSQSIPFSQSIGPSKSKKEINIVKEFLTSKDQQIKDCLLKSLFELLHSTSSIENESTEHSTFSGINGRSSVNQSRELKESKDIINCDSDVESSYHSTTSHLKERKQKEQTLSQKYSDYVITDEIFQNEWKMKSIRKKNIAIKILQGIFSIYPTIMKEIYEYILDNKTYRYLYHSIVNEIFEFSSLYEIDCSLLHIYKEYMVEKLYKENKSIDIELYLTSILIFVNSDDTWGFEQSITGQLIDFLISLLQTNISSKMIECILLILNRLMWIDDEAFCVENQIDLLNYKMELETMQFDEKINQFIEILDEMTSNFGGNI